MFVLRNLLHILSIISTVIVFTVPALANGDVNLENAIASRETLKFQPQANNHFGITLRDPEDTYRDINYYREFKFNSISVVEFGHASTYLVKPVNTISPMLSLLVNSKGAIVGIEREGSKWVWRGGKWIETKNFNALLSNDGHKADFSSELSPDPENKFRALISTPLLRSSLDGGESIARNIITHNASVFQELGLRLQNSAIDKANTLTNALYAEKNKIEKMIEGLNDIQKQLSNSEQLRGRAEADARRLAEENIQLKKQLEEKQRGDVLQTNEAEPAQVTVEVHEAR